MNNSTHHSNTVVLWTRNKKAKPAHPSGLRVGWTQSSPAGHIKVEPVDLPQAGMLPVVATRMDVRDYGGYISSDEDEANDSKQDILNNKLVVEASGTASAGRATAAVSLHPRGVILDANRVAVLRWLQRVL